MEINKETVIAITGTSSGIGRAIALALAPKGAKIATIARSGESLCQLEGELKQLGASDVFSQVSDITDEDATDRWIQGILEKWGRIDVLVNNAGIGIMKPVEHLSDEDWFRVISTNLTAPFRLIRSVIPPMKKQGGGHIINISSIAGEVGFAGGGAYCASKFGLQGLSDCLMQEVRRDNIRVTIIGPGSVNTRFDSKDDKAKEEGAWKVQPEEIAGTILHVLELPANAMVTKLQVRPTIPAKK